MKCPNCGSPDWYYLGGWAQNPYWGMGCLRCHAMWSMQDGKPEIFYIPESKPILRVGFAA